MTIPLRVTFRGLPPSEAIEERIRQKAEKLERLHGDITSCHVVVETPHRHQHSGRLYSVHFDVTIPGAELAVSREPGKDHSHEDVYIALRDAFAALLRQLDDHSKRRHDVAVSGASSH